MIPAPTPAPTPTSLKSRLPDGFRIVLDRDTRQLSGDRWLGGSPARVLRLTPAGRDAWHRLADGAVDSPATAVLARRLTDAGLAHPLPLQVSPPPDVTVVVPVRDRAALLSRCLGGLAGRYPVVVVDDGSRDPAAVAKVAADHGANLIRHSASGGPAAARNTGLAHVGTELVALVDSDCAPPPGWLERLAGHFADPTVAAVAPRILPLAGDDWVGRYARADGALDMGERPALVVPAGRVSYVPTAALLARTAALRAVARQGDVFDPLLRHGEDVDLVWRLHGAGWRVRYDPSVQMGHHEPPDWRGLLARRVRYGTSAAPLAVRHPGRLSHLVLPSPLALAGMPRAFRAHGIPAGVAARTAGRAVGQAWLSSSRYATRFGAPALVALALPGGGTAGVRRMLAGALLFGPPVAGWVGRRPALDPVRYALGALAADLAYGAGVWYGCLVHRTAAPLRPVIRKGNKRHG